MNGLITFLEDCGKIDQKDQAEIFPRIKFLWQQIINRPYTIQQNFFNVSHHLLSQYNGTYKKLLEQLCSLSKQNRKHMVQDIFPELEINLGLVQSMSVKTEGKEKGEQPYADHITKLIQKMMDSENKESLDAMK